MIDNKTPTTNIETLLYTADDDDDDDHAQQQHYYHFVHIIVFDLDCFGS